MKKTSLGKRKRFKNVLGMLAVTLLLTGCGSPSTDSSNIRTAASNSSVGGYYESAAYGEEDAVFEAANGEWDYESGEDAETVTDAAAQTERKLIKTVDMTVETKEFDKTLQLLQDKINACGGYVESMNTYNGSAYSDYRSSRDASVTARIPNKELDGFLDTVSGISNVIRKNEQVEDVTLTYVDLESHKEALETEQKRLLELLEKAETVEDIITIESRLSDVRYQIESMGSQLRTYDNKIDYSTVYLDISEVRELTPVEEKTTWERISSGFLARLKGVGHDVKEFFVWFLVNLPYLVIWAAVIALVVCVIRWLKKIGKKRKTTKKEKQAKSRSKEQEAQLEGKAEEKAEAKD